MVTFVLSLFQDVLRRVLEIDGFNVKHVRNITDVDDKTIRESQANNQSLKAFTEHWTAKFHADCLSLNLLPPSIEPKAVDHIEEQIQLVEQLIKKNHAYIEKDGSVYFRVHSCCDYGKLNRIDQSELKSQTENSAGSTNLADEYDRESISDFALWKARKDEDGDNYWTSPWGEGRPGWHLRMQCHDTSYFRRANHRFARRWHRPVFSRIMKMKSHNRNQPTKNLSAPIGFIQPT